MNDGRLWTATCWTGEVTRCTEVRLTVIINVGVCTHTHTFTVDRCVNKYCIEASCYILFPSAQRKRSHKKVKGNAVPWRRMGSGCKSHFVELGNSWRWVVSFTSWPLYSRGKSPQYQLDRRLGGPHSRSGHCGDTSLHRDSNSDPSVVQPVASHFIDYAISALCSHKTRSSKMR
jgi:hypothetical protein